MIGLRTNSPSTRNQIIPSFGETGARVDIETLSAEIKANSFAPATLASHQPADAFACIQFPPPPPNATSLGGVRPPYMLRQHQEKAAENTVSSLTFCSVGPQGSFVLDSIVVPS
eukprot:scaffold10166_cov127-Skeletonema_marinoi.AAC.8